MNAAPSSALRAALLSLAAVGAFALGAVPCAAQAGGFTPGDLWLSNDALKGLIRIDPFSGVTTLMQASNFQNGFGGLGFDPYRHRLIWRATANPPFVGQHTWLVDGAGQLSDTGIVPQLIWFAPAGDGRIFAIENTGGPRYVAWIDAANRSHRVLDAAGVGSYLLPAGPFLNTRGMVYDPGTNALYCCSHIDCDNVGHQQIVVGKLALSADGTRVLGPPTCASIDITSSFLEEPVSLSRMPDGKLLVVCMAPNQAPDVPLPRLLNFDPATMSFSTFALTGPQAPGDTYRIDDGVWSSALGTAVVLDTFKDKLRSFAPGSTGNGTAITPTGIGVSGNGGIAEAEQLTEISVAACAGAWVPYSVGLKGKGAFVPALMGGGCPVPGEPITLSISDVVGGASGVLFVGLGPAAVPFKGGVFAVSSLFLSPAIGVAGAAGVAGAGGLVLPTALPADPVISGVSVYMQCAFTDAAAVKQVSLTQGLQMEIG